VAAPAIEVSDLHKSYGPLDAVRGVSFMVERGEVFGLLGPNGAGKTTTVEILEGYRHRSRGDVRVLGHDPERRERRWQERIGIVLQSCGATPGRRSSWSGSRTRRTRGPKSCPAGSDAGSTWRSPWSATPS
jgi:ABC-type multidrug transport system ATPase subunit